MYMTDFLTTPMRRWQVSIEHEMPTWVVMTTMMVELTCLADWLLKWRSRKAQRHIETGTAAVAAAMKMMTPKHMGVL